MRARVQQQQKQQQQKQQQQLVDFKILIRIRVKCPQSCIVVSRITDRGSRIDNINSHLVERWQVRHFIALNSQVQQQQQLQQQQHQQQQQQQLTRATVECISQSIVRSINLFSVKKQEIGSQHDRTIKRKTLKRIT